MAETLINGIGIPPTPLTPVRTMINTPSGIRVYYADQNGRFLAEITILAVDQNLIADLLSDTAGAFRSAIIRAPAGLADNMKTRD